MAVLASPITLSTRLSASAAARPVDAATCWIR
jgi:hypothetical protein